MSRVSDFKHIPVLEKQVIETLAIRPGGRYVDCTLGGGGHSGAILARLSERGQLLALDRDPDALAAGKQYLQTIKTKASWQIRQSVFSELPDCLSEMDWPQADGILADLGVSSWQLDESSRGFTYRQDGPLDMRMNPGQTLDAAEIVNTWPAQELERVLRDYGEERHARKLSQDIVRARAVKPFLTTGQLAEFIITHMPAKSRREEQHPARRVFQGLRIAVNQELDELEKLLAVAPHLLSDGGRLVIITFHSLEDRLVKSAFRKLENPCTCPRNFPVCACGKKPLGRVVHRRGLTADTEERDLNKRSVSARLRCFERLVDKEVQA